MAIKTEMSSLNSELVLWEPSQSFLSFSTPSLSLIWQDEQPIACHLVFQVSLELYQQIDTKALFNLKLELRSSNFADFQADLPIQIEITLKPDRLPDLIPDATTADAIAHHLLELSQNTPNHPLLHTENWLALSVKQRQESGEVGYTTLWKTLNPAAIAAGTVSEADVSEAVSHFFSDWAEANLSILTKQTTAQILDEVGNFFKELADTSVEALSESISRGTIFDQMLSFFTEEDWSFTKLKGKSMLQMMFQGDHGEWTCYARTREEQQQFIFYSVCPITAPENKRSPLAEFLTRANYGMTIGNFEMDFSDGEIRYKTSIDVEGDRLSYALIERLVYTNVAMMDEYLPGIKAVLEGETPEVAIRAIEQGDESISGEG